MFVASNLAIGVSLSTWCLAVQVLQQTLHVLLLRASRLVGGELYTGSVCIILADLIKLSVSLIVLAFREGGLGRSRFFRAAFRRLPRHYGDDAGVHGDVERGDRHGDYKINGGSHLIHGGKQPSSSSSSRRGDFKSAFVSMLRTSPPMLIPAGCFTLQSVFYITGATYLPATLFQVSQQLKIITTALFSVAILGQELSAMQWASLPTLAIGVALMSMPRTKSTTLPVDEPFQGSHMLHQSFDMDDQDVLFDDAVEDAAGSIAASAAGASSLAIGLAAVVAACVLSGFASVHIEKMLKQPRAPSLIDRNAQLSMYGVLLGLVYALVIDGARIKQGGWFQGFGFLTWCIVLMQALSGFVVSLVIKYADNIMKNFASAFSTLLTASLSYPMFGDVPSPLAFLGGISTFLSVYMFNGSLGKAFKLLMKRKKGTQALDHIA